MDNLEVPLYKGLSIEYLANSPVVLKEFFTKEQAEYYKNTGLHTNSVHQIGGIVKSGNHLTLITFSSKYKYNLLSDHFKDIMSLDIKRFITKKKYYRDHATATNDEAITIDFTALAFYLGAIKKRYYCVPGPNYFNSMKFNDEFLDIAEEGWFWASVEADDL